jgi:hypothetical protein
MRPLLLAVLAAAAPLTALSAQTAASSSGTLAERVAREIKEVRGGATPAQWLQAHAEEKLQAFNGPQFANDTLQWCARTVVTYPAAAGRPWSRTVYFYDPQPTADGSLPSPEASQKEVLETTCRLGLVWIDIPEGDSAVGTKLSDDIQAALASQYGSGSDAPRSGPGGFGSAGWTGARQWPLGDATLTVAYDQFKGKAHRVLVRLAFANSDAIHDGATESEQARKDLTAEIAGLVGKVRNAGNPAVPTSRMAALLETPDYFSGRNPPSDAEVVASLRDWLGAAKSGSPGQQAMALVAADGVLDFLNRRGVPAEEASRAAMKSLGVEYVHSELAGADLYAHGLLKQARAMVPAGYSSDQVLLAEMEHGFDETGMCSAGEEEFSQVIRQGESLLAGARALPTPTLSSLHFMVGDAYATIVWLAGADNGYHDPKKYQPMEASAHAKALQHYRAGLSLEHGTPRALKAWKEAWRLAVGLPPTSGRYFCVYD